MPRVKSSSFHFRGPCSHAPCRWCAGLDLYARRLRRQQGMLVDALQLLRPNLPDARRISPESQTDHRLQSAMLAQSRDQSGKDYQPSAAWRNDVDRHAGPAVYRGEHNLQRSSVATVFRIAPPHSSKLVLRAHDLIPSIS
jgi:hypothetical protein